MRAAGHASVGFFTGLLVSGLPYLVETIAPTMDKTEPVAGILIGTGVAVLTASLPDRLEPSKKRGPNHRSIFHSWTVLLILAGTAFAIFSGRLTVSPDQAWGFIYPAIAGYLSHLVVDRRSTKGLPAFW